jgi:hypothetical protein
VAEHEEEKIIVTDRGGGGGGSTLAIVIAVIVLLVVLFLLFGRGWLSGGETTDIKADVDISAPEGGGAEGN